MPVVTLDDYFSPRDQAKRNIRQLDKAVKGLVGEFGSDAYIAMETAIGKWKLDMFKKTHGVTEAGGRHVVLRLIGRQELECREVEPPGCDHPELFNWRGKPLFFIYHPYHAPDPKALDDFCREYGLKWQLSAHSWYKPGSTVMVVMWHPDRLAERQSANSNGASPNTSTGPGVAN